ncbi:GNAT family N-acetyltransferase [Pedobacter changchengzhani]|uniref:GNAT family N-acetyltransferase n=1 Tax=Pedobacter changchengzhani TaxID=2529274 RepID=A0A4R5MLX3_9SPHI|nr:GNAT family N-acetyltransferase [Pedobacter changchengzhani]TDG36757.1 GNAT family N-acetyltransferase [Pedobacter changchengzhani]
MAVTFRKLTKADNVDIASLIRKVFDEFAIPKQGTVYTDPTTDKLFELFQQYGSDYWLAEEDGMLLGGCGIFPTDGLPDGCVELVKLYVSKSSRDKGIGKALLQKSIESAQHFGYNEVYLESFPELEKAISMYENFGFKLLEKPLGNSGHFACNVWMLLVL